MATSTIDERLGPPTWVRWALVVLWLAVIFWFSAQSDSGEQSGLLVLVLFKFLPVAPTPDLFEAANHLLRKTAHFTVYATLAGLLWWALPPRTWRYVAAWVLAAAYAATDEWHQSFIANRGPSPWDVALDSAGALTALVVIWLVTRWHRR